MSYPSPYSALISRITDRERITVQRLGKIIAIDHNSLGEWKAGRRRPSKSAITLLKLIDRHGLNALFGGELTQPIEPQANDRLKIT